MLFSTSALAAIAALTSLGAAAPATESSPRTRAAGGKLTIYWGAEDDNLSLMDVCNDSTYDIVNLAFLAYFNKAGGYPGLEMSGLDGPSSAQRKAGATGLKDGSPLVPAIKKCQANGKLVILSMGGATDYSDVRLSSDAQGEKVADQVWNLFLGGTGHKELRPFGDVKLDGVDLDNETNDSTGYLAMTKRFRANMAKDSSKKYYLTAAPQCPFPDQSEPLSVCKLLDYVWVQFYNNGDCNIAQSGFNAAVKNWSKGIGSAKLFIGGLASGADGDEGYVDSNTFIKALKGVEAMNLPNYGGAMLWEAQLSKTNGDFAKKIRSSV
ncbi:hypothetical protein LLEC1_05039 [Akanthomyces lecanii]|uniref:chitinase n=1 Tax=Cordyceps confragosa TaxID=2714763 RepID=A0A179I8D2_CORDF|nr:hypothetical protein LLEC1_05039 [Akanthomyces lecanii]